MDNARKRQDTLQMAKFSDIQALMDHLNKQKARPSLHLPHILIAVYLASQPNRLCMIRQGDE